MLCTEHKTFSLSALKLETDDKTQRDNAQGVLSYWTLFVIHIQDILIIKYLLI